jgi:hypothetical protein
VVTGGLMGLAGFREEIPVSSVVAVANFCKASEAEKGAKKIENRIKRARLFFVRSALIK